MSCDGHGVLIVETITSARQPRWRAGHAAPDLARTQQTASPVNNNSSDGGRKTCSVVTSCDVVLGAIGWLRMMPLHMFRLTLKKEATKPPAANFLQQQAKFDDFLEVFQQ